LYEVEVRGFGIQSFRVFLIDKRAASYPSLPKTRKSTPLLFHAPSDLPSDPIEDIDQCEEISDENSSCSSSPLSPPKISQESTETPSIRLPPMNNTKSKHEPLSSRSPHPISQMFNTSLSKVHPI